MITVIPTTTALLCQAPTSSTLCHSAHRTLVPPNSAIPHAFNLVWCPVPRPESVGRVIQQPSHPCTSHPIYSSPQA